MHACTGRACKTYNCLRPVLLPGQLFPPEVLGAPLPPGTLIPRLKLMLLAEPVPPPLLTLALPPLDPCTTPPPLLRFAPLALELPPPLRLVLPDLNPAPVPAIASGRAFEPRNEARAGAGVSAGGAMPSCCSRAAIFS